MKSITTIIVSAALVALVGVAQAQAPEALIDEAKAAYQKGEKQKAIDLMQRAINEIMFSQQKALGKFFPTVEGFKAMEMPEGMMAMGGFATRTYQKIGEEGKKEEGKQVTVSIMPGMVAPMPEMPPGVEMPAPPGEKLTIQGKAAYLSFDPKFGGSLTINLKNGSVGISAMGFDKPDVLKTFAAKIKLADIEAAISK